MANPVDEFLKSAAIPGQPGFWGRVGQGFAEQGPKALVGAGIAAAGAAFASGGKWIRDRITKARDYRAVIAANPHLKKFDAGQTQMVYNSLRTMSPIMARDPIVAGSFIRQTLELSPDQGPAVSMQTVNLLAKSQQALQEDSPFDLIGAGASRAPDYRLPSPPPAPPFGPGNPKFVAQHHSIRGLRGEFGNQAEAEAFANKPKKP
jgi:hypothetical protein